jgi:hypothetical protein
MHISERTSQDDRKIIGYSNPVLSGLSLSQTIIKLPEFNNQSIGLEHILPMGIQNNGKIKWLQKTIKFNHPHLISTISNPQAIITTDASPIA